MLKVFFLMTILLPLLILADVSSCTSKTAITQNIEVSCSPNQPEVGDTVTLIVTYDLLQTITEGSIVYQVNLNGFPVVNQKDDLCTDIAKGNDPCPLAIGFHNTTASFQVPDVSGDISGSVIWSQTPSNLQIFCLQFSFDI